MWKKLLITVVGLLAIIAGIAGIFIGMVKTMMAAPQGMPAASVTTVEVKQEAWHPALTSVGSLTAVQGVAVSAQLDGTVTAIHFQPGTKMNAFYQLPPAPSLDAAKPRSVAAGPGRG